jgi:hypothetical protein
MTQFVFMNHRIREKKPSGPVIVVQHAGVQRESNDFILMFRGQPIGRVVFPGHPLDAVETHEVRAWVELDDDVEVVDAAAVAAAKRPNRKVKPK